MKYLFLLFLSMVFVSKSNSQTTVYHPFPTGNAYWRESSEGYQCCCSDYQYMLKGDTLIGNYTYQKVEQSGVMLDNNPGGWCITGGYSYFFKYYKGSIRNDIPDKKVYFFPSDETNEQLLYDFNLALHDTLSLSYIYTQNWYGSDYFICVESIDSVLVGGEYHKRYGIATTYDIQNIYAYLIEGVGSTYGLFGSIFTLWPPFEFGSFLECFSVDGEPVLTGDPTSCLLVTSSEIAEKLVSCSIFPNPMKEASSILLPGSIQQADLVVIDMCGREVMSYKGIMNGSMIYRNQLKQGIYFYHFDVHNAIICSGKLILD